MEKDKMLYMYVYRMILSNLYSGEYRFQDKLPTLAEIGEQYHVGRNTVRSALNMLKEEGYVTMQKGVKATVCFDRSRFESQERYKQAVINSRQMISNIFKTMELIFPDIVIECLDIATTEQINDLVYRLETFSIDDVSSSKQVMDKLFGVYLYIFSFLNNPLLNDLFMTMMYSLYTPVTSSKDRNSVFEKSMKAVSSIFHMAAKLVKARSTFLIKNAVTLLCKSTRKITLNYVDTLCEGMEVKDDSRFIWISNRNQEYLYAQVVFGVLNDIYYHVYERNTLLPSIAKLSELYDVSEKTSRKALEVLREYHAIETINGVGSKVTVDDIVYNPDILKRPEFISNLKDYYYSLQLLKIIIPTILLKYLKDAPQDMWDDMANVVMEGKTLSLEHLYQYAFSKCNYCLNAIYVELRKPLNWSVFVDRVSDYSQYDFVAMQKKIILAISQKDIATIVQTSTKTMEISLDSTRKLIQDVDKDFI